MKENKRSTANLYVVQFMGGIGKKVEDVEGGGWKVEAEK